MFVLYSFNNIDNLKIRTYENYQTYYLNDTCNSSEQLAIKWSTGDTVKMLYIKPSVTTTYIVTATDYAVPQI